LVVTELSNLANVLVNGNLDVLGVSNLANVTAGNLVVTELSNLANVLVNGNLDVLGTSNLANLSAGNLELSGTANITGDTTLNSNLLITGEHYTFFTDANTYIHGQTAGGNLDITNLAGNVNIRANTDIILTTNTGSTIKLVGPTEQMLAVSEPSAGNIYMNFGANIGDLGYGIWSDNGVLKRKNDGDAGWVELSSGTGGANNLANLGDVQFALPLANNEILAYDSTLSKWTNSTLGNVVAELGYYGAFYDNTTQDNIPANTSRAMKCNTTAEAKGVSVDTNGVFTVDNAGVYNIQFSAQLTKTDSGNDIVDIWFRKNGSNIAESNTEYTVVGNNGRSVAALNYVLTLAANNTIEIMWRAADSQISLLHQVATSNVPAIPSVIVTITPVQYIQDGTLALGDLLNVNTTGQANNNVLQYNSDLNRWDTRANLTIEPGSLAIFGSSANISSNAATGNLVINAGNLDISGASGLTHIHNNLLVSGNLSVSGLSNLANVGISGNLDVLGSSNLANVSMGNLVVLELSNLANVGVSGNLDVLGDSNLAGNINVYGLAGFNSDVGVLGNLGILGGIVGGNAEFGNIIVRESGKVEFRDATTFIHSGETGNLDIKSLDGNVNITANGDIILTSNSPSTIKLVGPGNSPMVAFSQDAGGNTFMSFGSTTGESGYGIKADATGNVLIKSQGASGWASVSNTTIAIGNTSISLGNTYTGLDLSNSTGYQTSNLVGTITNAQLANSNVSIAGKTVNLGSSNTPLAFSDLTGNIALGQIDPVSITNNKLSNSNIVIGGQTINLGGSGSLAFNNITGNIALGQIDNTSLTNGKLANSSFTIGGQTINLGGSGNLSFSNLTGTVDRIIFTDDKIKLGSSSGGTAGTGDHSIAIGTSAGAQNQGNACIAIGSSAQALLGNYNDHRIAIGFTTGTSNQSTKAIAIGSYAGANNQGANSVAIGYYAGNSSQPSSSIILSATGDDWSSGATTANAFYVKPVRNVTTTNVNPSLYYNTTSGEISYNTRDCYALSMYGNIEVNFLNNSNSSTYKDLFALTSAYWETAPNVAGPTSNIFISPIGDTRYNYTTGIITLTNTKKYLLDVNIQLCIAPSADSKFQMELIKNPASASNSIVSIMQVGVANDPNYAQFTLPMKYIINSWDTMKICVYKTTGGTGLAASVSTDCEIVLSLLEI